MCCYLLAVSGLEITSDASPSRALPSKDIFPQPGSPSPSYHHNIRSPKRTSIVQYAFRCGTGQLCSKPLGDIPVFPNSSKALPSFQNCHGPATGPWAHGYSFPSLSFSICTKIIVPELTMTKKIKWAQESHVSLTAPLTILLEPRAK